MTAVLSVTVLAVVFALGTAAMVWRYRRDKRYELLPDRDPTFRKALRDRAAKLLQPEDHVRQVFLAQTGPAPNRIGFHSWPYLRFRAIVITDEDAVVLAIPFGQYRPRRVVSRVPNSLREMRASGNWTQVEIADEKLWVHDRWQPELTAARTAS